MGEQNQRGCLGPLSVSLPPPLRLGGSLGSEGLLGGGRPPALWREHDNKVYRREDYTIPALPLV